MRRGKEISRNGKAVFYASIYDDLKQAAIKCGWALGLHGSLANDMDIMAMPWTEDAKPVEEMIQALSDCFEDNPFKDMHKIPHYDKPNNRVVYTMPIWEDFYLDINIIQPTAYNIDKAIEQLEKELILADAEKIRCSRKNPLQFDSAKGYAMGIYNAIEIVKGRL